MGRSEEREDGETLERGERAECVRGWERTESEEKTKRLVREEGTESRESEEKERE